MVINRQTHTIAVVRRIEGTNVISSFISEFPLRGLREAPLSRLSLHTDTRMEPVAPDEYILKKNTRDPMYQRPIRSVSRETPITERVCVTSYAVA